MSIKDLKLNFTGKMTILVELEDYGPIQWRINDKDITLEICRIIIEKMGESSAVDSYTKREEKKYRSLFNFE